mmetsp:Transcript_29582/g.64302  ORF Transcript_29582/g.64302 Transcript_29582/m.64302 type:complete len:512 (+) Transcript_29582:24-1559(+)
MQAMQGELSTWPLTSDSGDAFAASAATDRGPRGGEHWTSAQASMRASWPREGTRASVRPAAYIEAESSRPGNAPSRVIPSPSPGTSSPSTWSLAQLDNDQTWDTSGEPWSSSMPLSGELPFSGRSGDPALASAAHALAAELRSARLTADRVCGDSEDVRLRDSTKAAREALELARERALSLRARAASFRENAAVLSRDLAQDAQSFAVEEERGKAAVAAQRAEAQDAVARLRAQASLARKRLEARQAWLEEEGLAGVASGSSTSSSRVGPTGVVHAERVRAVALALDDACSAWRGDRGDAVAEAVAHWLRLAAEAASSAAEMPSSLRQTELRQAAMRQESRLADVDRAAATMAERFLERADGAQGAVDGGRLAEIEGLVRSERAREAKLADLAAASKQDERRLTAELVEARRRKREVEAEQAAFVPFAAEELEGAVERVARMRAAPSRVRRLAATAGHRLRQQRRASSAGRSSSHGARCCCCCCCRRCPETPCSARRACNCAPCRAPWRAC